MLTVTVKEGEYIKIGNDIFVKYTSSLRADSISLSIQAPKEIPIARSKVYEKNLEQKAKSDSSAVSELEKARKMKGRYKKPKLKKAEEI